MRIICESAVIETFIDLLICHDRVRPPDDSTDEGSISGPLSAQCSGLQPVAGFVEACFCPGV